MTVKELFESDLINGTELVQFEMFCAHPVKSGIDKFCVFSYDYLNETERYKEIEKYKIERILIATDIKKPYLKIIVTR